MHCSYLLFDFLASVVDWSYVNVIHSQNRANELFSALLGWIRELGWCTRILLV